MEERAVAYFEQATDGALVPLELSVSLWSRSQIGGYAVCGALARELESCHPGDGFVPARLTVDLFAPVRTAPLRLTSTVVRRGKRIVVVDGAVHQEGEVRARATAVYLADGETPPGQIWHNPDSMPSPPAVQLPPDGAYPLIKSGDGDWTPDFAANQTALRKSIWQTFPPLVRGEPMSPLQRAAVMGEATSFLCNWGTEGVGFINSDLTLTLSRLPVGDEVGLHVTDHVQHGGVAIGSATLIDRRGPVGICVVTALSNARRQIDLATAIEPSSVG
jgi:hypothetical protein